MRYVFESSRSLSGENISYFYIPHIVSIIARNYLTFEQAFVLHPEITSKWHVYCSSFDKNAHWSKLYIKKWYKTILKLKHKINLPNIFILLTNIICCYCSEVLGDNNDINWSISFAFPLLLLCMVLSIQVSSIVSKNIIIMFYYWNLHFQNNVIIIKLMFIYIRHM